MVILYLVPKWFVGLDSALEVLFALISLFVAVYSFRIYKMSGQRGLKLFGISFSLISLSYFIWAILNIFILDKLKDGIIGIPLEHLASLSSIGFAAHIILFTVGLATLAYTTFRIKNYRVYLLLIVLTVMSIAISINKVMAFYIVSSLLLLSIVSYYSLECNPKKNPKSIMVLLAFISIFASTVILIFATRSYLYYVLAHALELLAYLLILASLVLTLKNEQKKK